MAACLAALAGCYGAHREGASGADGGADAAVTCGAMTCDQVPANACISADTLRTYAATCTDNACSYPPTDVACGSAGCCTDHCCTLAASNGDVTGELAPTGLDVAPPKGMFDTDTDCTATSALGACAVVPRTGLGEACVCRMDTLAIDSLKVTGARALVILAYQSVDITTLLDISGDTGTDGPGASARYAAAGAPTVGGPGGSYQTVGGSATDGSAAAVRGDPTLIPLAGGMRGESTTGAGGGGGGAVQITAGQRISIPGVINAGGGGGGPGFGSYSESGAGGGGSGGAVLLEAPSVTATGSVVANGGGGGGGGGNAGSGGTGSGGNVTIASGGFGQSGAGCPLYGYVSGGNGGAGATATNAAYAGDVDESDGRCIGPISFVGAGGGGGGLGRIRVNTASGCNCDGTFSPQASFGTVSVR